MICKFIKKKDGLTDRPLSLIWEKWVVLLSVFLFFTGCASLQGKNDIALGRIKIEYARQGTGGPPVVFVTGLGGEMDSWAPVFDRVSTFTTAFAYDRCGYGESGKPAGSKKISKKGEIAKTAVETVADFVVPGISTLASIGKMASRTPEDTSPREGDVIVTELYETLKAAEIKPPYIMVGHSLGGLYVSLFSRRYPGEEAGVVLVDSMHPEQVERCKEYLPEKECDPECYPWWVKMLIKMSPGVIRAEMAGMSETGKEIRAAGPLPSVPLIVIIHGKPPSDSSDKERMWAALQQELVYGSDTGTHIIAMKSGHNIQKDEPDLVAGAIRDIVAVTRGTGDVIDY